MPQTRTIDREKMAVEQFLEEAQMFQKTWRYQEALHSYDEALQRELHSRFIGPRKAYEEQETILRVQTLLYSTLTGL